MQDIKDPTIRNTHVADILIYIYKVKEENKQIKDKKSKGQLRRKHNSVVNIMYNMGGEKDKTNVNAKRTTSF